MSNAIVIKKSDGNFFSQLAKSLKSGAGSVARLKPAPNFKEAALDRIVARKLIDSQIGPGNLTYADALYGSTVLLVDPRDRQTRLKHWLRDNAVDLNSVDSLRQANLNISTSNQPIGLVILDLESCGGIALVASDLIAFRLRHQTTPVILISDESAVDDFSTERLAITDVTLRGPVSLSRLDLALAEAQINNQVWQDRNAASLP